MVSHLFNVSKDFILREISPLIVQILLSPLTFAYVAEVVHVQVVSIEQVLIIELQVLAEITGWMLTFIVFIHSIIPV